MSKNRFFKRINFNKPWSEEDWEKYFQAHEAYRLSVRNLEVKKKPAPKIQFETGDEVKAFDPILRAYGLETTPNVVYELKESHFVGDKDPDEEYTPTTLEDPHFWGEGAPLASLPIYRDSCRFAITTSLEIERYLKRRDNTYRKRTSSKFENLKFHANWAAVNVAQGHQIGYSSERIRGNIAKCRRAVNHANLCIRIINQISRSTKSERLKRELFSFAVQLRHALFLWIDELRSRLT